MIETILQQAVETTAEVKEESKSIFSKKAQVTEITDTMWNCFMC